MRPFSKDEIHAASLHIHCKCMLSSINTSGIFLEMMLQILFACSILHGHTSPSCINRTNLALIPKVKNPATVVEFHPIALCNVLYKLVSKALVIRLK